MKGFHDNLEKATIENSHFRRVLYTGKNLQLVLMTLQVGEEIGMETHLHNDQFFRFESGSGKCVIDGHTYTVGDGDVIVVPAGAEHNVINTDSAKALKMYTIYAPPNHQAGIDWATKAEAVSSKEHFDGKTTE